MKSGFKWFESFITIHSLNEDGARPLSEYFIVRKRIILISWFLQILSHREWNSTTSYMLLRSNMMSTSSFEYEDEFHDIKISTNAYNYQKLWVWFDSTHCWSRVRKQILLISSWRVEINNIMRIIKYEFDEYFRL